MDSNLINGVFCVLGGGGGEYGLSNDATNIYKNNIGTLLWMWDCDPEVLVKVLTSKDNYTSQMEF